MLRDGIRRLVQHVPRSPAAGDDRDADGVGRVAEQPSVILRAGLVKDHAADASPWVVGSEAVQQGGGRGAEPARVRHQDDRRAQQGGQMRRIGVLMAISADDAEAQARIAAFVQGLQQLGWTVGKDVRVDYRLAGIDADTLRKYATELVTVAPDVILVQSSPALAAMLQATRTIPIVFALIADPVGAGYVDSLAHPGGNATGFTVFEYSIGGKWLELLKEIAPR